MSTVSVFIKNGNTEQQKTSNLGWRGLYTTSDWGRRWAPSDRQRDIAGREFADFAVCVNLAVLRAVNLSVLRTASAASRVMLAVFVGGFGI